MKQVTYNPPNLDGDQLMKLFDLIDRIDMFVGYLEEEDVEFDQIMDALREYISIVDDINGTAGL